MDEFDKIFGSSLSNDEDEFDKMFGDINVSSNVKADPNSSDFITGVQRGIQNLQASAYGAAALAGAGVKKLGAESVGQSIQDFGVEGYKRNIEEAQQFPAKHTFKDVYTGEAGVGGAIDWAQGTLGELVPSMVEAGIGAAVGSAVAPGPGTAVGGLAGRTILKKGIEKATEQAIKRGIVDLAEGQLEKQVTSQALKKLGAKVGLGAAVMPVESGATYGELLAEKGIDAPGTALLAGAAKTAIEFAGGNSKLVDTFVDAVSKGATGTIKKTARELLSNIPQEAAQEGSQELIDVLATVANTDEKLLTVGNLERIIESMAAGAIGGGAGALVNAGFNNNAKESKLLTEQEIEINRRAGNILNLDKNELNQSIQKLSDDIKVNQELLNDPVKFDQKIREQNIEPEELIRQIVTTNKTNQALLDKVNSGIKAKEEQVRAQAKKEYDALSPEEKAIIDAKNKLDVKRQETAIAINDQINDIDAQIDNITKAYGRLNLDGTQTPEDKQKLADNYINLNKERNKLLDRYKEEVVRSDLAPYTTREERQKIYEDLFGTYSRTVPSDKDAKESFQVFEANDLLPVEIANYANDLMKAKAEQQALDAEKQLLIPVEENNLKQITDYANYIKGLSERFTPEEQSVIENYWQGVKKELNLHNEEMTPGTEAFMRKKFFESKLAEIEGNVKQDTEVKSEPDKKIVPSLAEQNKRQAWFKQIATELGDLPATNLQEVQTEIPRNLPGGIKESFINERQVGQGPQFQVGENQNLINKLTLADIQKTFPNQTITQDEDGKVLVQFKNGKGLAINSIQNVGQDLIELAIETGQMSKDGKIFGITTGNNILLDSNFADNKTLWHENKHVLDNLGLITEADNSALNKEFNKLRKAGKLEFAISTHKDSRQAMVENRANTFAQIMTNREAYRNTSFGKVIQRVLDFFNQLFSFGKQTVSGLAREVESGKIYERQVGNQTISTTITQTETAANQWHSALENAVNGFQQKVATPDQWKGMIKGYPGIKQEELDWIGLDEWLDSKDGKVSKDELVKFIAENNVRLEEVIKQPKRSYGEIINEKLKPLGYSFEEEYGEWSVTDKNGDLVDDNDIPTEVRRIILNNGINTQSEVAQYEIYQLPGGKNYKEMLITIPPKYKPISDFKMEDKVVGTLQESTNYKSVHWDEPNILTHIRFNERTDVDGNRVLFLEEVQSDWHQEGRKEGYQSGKPTGLKIKSGSESKGYFEVVDANGNFVTNISASTYNGPWDENSVLAEAARRVENSPQQIGFERNAVPDAPFKKSWPLLAMKRMIRYASENGFDKIAWTTGEQQANRYNLAQQVQSIKYYKKPNGNYNIKYLPNNEERNNPNAYQTIGEEIPKNEIENYVGREIADKIINDKGVNRGDVFHYLDNPDLKVGGEGMKAFYDQMLPSMLNKEFNRGKWGNARVEQTQLGESKTRYFIARDNDPMYGYDTLEEAQKYLKELQGMDQEFSYSIVPVESGNVFTSLSIPITNRMKSKALREGMPMFEVREAPTQKISDETYNQMFAERNNLVRTIGQTLRMRGHEIKQLIDKGLGSISTRLKNVDPMLRTEIRNLDFRTSQKIVTALRVAQPLLKKTKEMSPEDKFVWDAARRNSDEVKIKQIADKYGMTADQEKLRSVLNQIRQDAIDVGYDVGYIEEYWPRIIKDQEGFLQATKGISQRPVITDAIKRYADKLGMTVEQFELNYPEQAADIASNTILGRNLGIGGPGNIQARQYETVPPELNKFYMDSDAALMQYIYSMTKKIEARRFFGKVPERIANLKTEKKRKTGMLADYEEQLKLVRDNQDESAKINARIEDVSGDLIRIEQELDKYKLQRDYNENIGTYINDLRLSGRIQADEEKVVRDILDARFHEHGTTGIVNTYKNMAYIDVMGSPISALTQIGDLAWAMYVGKVWTPKGLSSTVKNIGKAFTKQSEITKEDLGIERIAQEFADGTTLGNAVNWVFRKVGLEKIDTIGKEVLINNALDNYKSMASTEAGRTELAKQIKPIFGTQTDSVINDLLANNPTDNVKMLLYHRLLDFQPVALSEMPEQYLKSGNGRVFYMLKTYTLKQFDVFRNEAWHKIKSGERDQVIEGIGNMIKLTSLLTLANAGSDEIKDWLLGKDTKFEDHVIENFLTMGGASKYVRMQTAREGLGSGLIGQILPPFRFINSLSKDLSQGYGDYIAGDTINFNHARIIESIPIGGKLYYWNYGRGEDYKKSSTEQEFSSIGKDVKLFKRQFENAQDKRNFLNSNLDKFKQMKLYDNFQASLNRNQAVINKLKEIHQTTNVRERLGQLKQQRELILKKYFEVAETMQ